MLHLELMKWAEFCAPFVVISVLFGFAYALHESVIRSEQLDKKRRATIRKQQKEIAAKDGAYKKLRRENAALRVRKVRSGRKLRRENAILRQQLAVAEAKLAENGRHEDGEIEIRDPEEEVDVDTVAVLPCEFDADLDFPPLALAEDLEDDEECEDLEDDEETPPVDRPEPEPALIPDDDDEITLGHDSPPRNSTPPSPTPTLKDTSPQMNENAPQSVIESSADPENTPRLGRILTVAYSKKAYGMVHVRRSARLLSAGTGKK